MQSGSFDVLVESNVMVRMRDGVRLATDVYRPQRAGDKGNGEWPVIMERTPYDKCGVSRSERTLAHPEPVTRATLAHYFASRGYTVVMQDCRGRYASEGTFTKYVCEAEDGADTMRWLLEQPWCNGRIGTMGMSYGAHTQTALASQSPAGLACMFMDSGGFANAWHGGIRRGGAFELKQVTWAYRHALRSPLTNASPERRAALEAEDLADWFRRQPWRPGHSPLRHAPEYEAYLFEQWQAGVFNDYWRQPGLCAEAHHDRFPDVPVAIIGSWYDPYVYTCIANYRGLAAKNRAPVTLLMGPWTHGNRSQTFAGAVDFGEQSVLDGTVADDYWQLRLQFFDRWLRADGDTAGSEIRPAASPVRYFCMGGGAGDMTADGRLAHGGAWCAAATWPPPGAVQKTWYLCAPGMLADSAPADEALVELRSDPDDPVPTIGGAVTSGEPLMRGGAFDQVSNETTFQYRGDAQPGPLADRDDVLVFETAPLDEDLIVCGPVEVQLWLSSDCPDTDITLKLVDVYPPDNDCPKGYAMNITDGILRLRYRDGPEREVFMETGAVYAATVRAFDTANRFRRGHRLRIEVAGSNYPQFDVNPNTGAPPGVPGDARVATSQIRLGGRHASRLVLSVLADSTA